MVDALLSPAAGAVMYGASLAGIAYSAAKIKEDDLSGKKIPVIGVMSAFVFAAQMINFTIPATGSSGHIGGGILLAAMLGGGSALLSVSSVLIIQCLFFADGGLLALGCNIFNLGVIPCLFVYPLVFKPLVKKGMTEARITAASIAAAVIGLQLGSLAVVLETWASGISKLPFETFLFLMQPIHLAIGLAEGVISAAVLCFIHKMRPEIMEGAGEQTGGKSGVGVGAAVTLLALCALISGGFLSRFASSNPDGLEWSIEKAGGIAESEVKSSVLESTAVIQDASAFMPGYDFRDAGEESSGAGTSLAGIAGGAITFAAAAAAVFIISLFKRKRGAKQAS